MGRPNLGTSRVIEKDDWCFLFVDSNAGILETDESGLLVDPTDYQERLHRNGALGAREARWIRQMCDTTPAAHVFIWLHHPPATPIGLGHDAAYTAEWQQLVGDLPKVRGFGAGHTHVPGSYDFEGRTVYVCPALKNNFDLNAATALPPGYRTYDFSPDGSVASQMHLCDDPQWPRRQLGGAVMALLRGELGWDDFEEIVARKRAGG